MLTRFVTSKIAAGRWDEFEAAYKKALAERGEVPGLLMQWLCRDAADPDTGIDISLWETSAALTAYVGSPARQKVIAALTPFYVSQFTATHSDVRHLIRAFPKREPGDLDIYHTN